MRHPVGFGVTFDDLYELSTRPDLEGVRLTIVDPQRCEETQEIESVETVLARFQAAGEYRRSSRPLD